MRSAIAVILFLCLALPMSAQTMLAHYPDRIVPLGLAELDSLTYDAETLGIPATIELSINYDGVDAGGAFWRLPVAALVCDQYGQPVADGKEVIFTLDSEDAQIDDGLTGNVSLFGQSSPGVAHTSLVFGSTQTNEPVQVYAFCVTAGGFARDTLDVTLAPQETTGLLGAMPTTFLFHEDDDHAVFELTIYAYDGHESGIPGVNIHLSPQFGRIYETETVSPSTEQSPFVVTDEDGQATRYLIISRAEAFPDPVIVERTCTVSGEIIGHGAASFESFTLFVMRDDGGNGWLGGGGR